MPRSRKLPIFLAICLCLAGAALWVLREGGPFLSVNNARKSDALLVLAGDHDDQRYWTALALLRRGLGRDLFVDARIDQRFYGRVPADAAAEFIRKTAGSNLPHVHICPVFGDSTKQEMTHVAPCLDSVHSRSVIVVSDDHHTRRALDTARHMQPQYSWTAAGVATPVGSRDWWRSRYGWKYAFIEWQRLVWWKLVESHT